MKFSIVIPTRNRAKLLPCALKSALDQDYDDYEIVVSNNASSDDTEEVVSQLMEDKIRYFKTDRLMSMVDHWNYAYDKIAGEWVFYLCDDDTLPSFTLSYMDEATRAYPDIEVMRLLRATYVYSDMAPYQSDHNCLIIPSTADGHVELINSRDVLLKAFRVLSEQIPKIHNSFVRYSLLDRIRQQYGSVFFRWAPDMSNGLLLLANTTHFNYLHQILSVWGENMTSYGPGTRWNAHKIHEFFSEFGDFEGRFPFSPYPDLFVLANALYDTFCGIRELLGDQGSGLEVDHHNYMRRLLRDMQRYIDMGFEDYREYYDIVAADLRKLDPEATLPKETRTSSGDADRSVWRLLRKIGRRMSPTTGPGMRGPTRKGGVERQIIYGEDSDPRFEDIYEATLYLNKHYKPPS